MGSNEKGFNSPLLISKIKSMTEAIDFVLSDESGEKYGFALIVFTKEQAMMTGNCDREITMQAVENVVKAHNSGEPMQVVTLEEMGDMMEAHEKTKH